MSRVVLAAIALTLAAFVAGCGSTPRCASVVNPPGAKGDPFLWKVQRGTGGPVVWFYGTIHNAGAAEVPAVAWAVFESSPRFVSELGDAEPDHDKLAELAIARTGKGLDQLLATDDWWDLRDVMRGVIKEDELRRMRPWYAMARLTQRVAPSASPTMDTALTNRARARKIPIEPLESWEDQLGILASSVEVNDLAQAIRSRGTIRCELTQMQEVYVAGDQATMTKLLVVPKSEPLLVQRNARWLPALEGLFHRGGAFVAVGLGHLIGEAGLLSTLGRSGYTVERSVR